MTTQRTGTLMGLLLLLTGGYLVAGWRGVGWVAVVWGTVTVVGSCAPNRKEKPLTKQEVDRVLKNIARHEGHRQ